MKDANIATKDKKNDIETKILEKKSNLFFMNKVLKKIKDRVKKNPLYIGSNNSFNDE